MLQKGGAQSMNYIKGTYIKEIFSNKDTGYLVGVEKSLAILAKSLLLPIPTFILPVVFIISE